MQSVWQAVEAQLLPITKTYCTMKWDQVQLEMNNG